MDLRLSDEEQQLVDAFSALYDKHSTPERVRECEPGGFDTQLWDRLVEQGVVAMGVAESDGGWGATMLDLALVAEQHGRHVAAAPLIEAQVAARLLARVADGTRANEELDAALSGERLVTLALHPADGDVALAVPAAAVADSALLLSGESLLLVDTGSGTGFANLGDSPLADLPLTTTTTTTISTGAAAVDAHRRAVDEWLLLSAAALVGIADESVRIGVEYVRERIAFGVPIGSFQAIAHPLADSATAVEGARLLTHEAAWAVRDQPARAAELAALAFGFAATAAADASARSLHFHGGYGFMMEYDIQLYWRRARAWSNVWGEPAAAYRRAADERYGSD